MAEFNNTKGPSELLDLLDSVIAPDGKVDSAAFDYFFNMYAESLSYQTEPEEEECICDIDEDDKDSEHLDECNYGNHDGWRDSTLKHKVFTYWPSKRHAGVGNYPAGVNDLPWVLATWASGEPDVWNGIMDEVEKYLEKK